MGRCDFHDTSTKLRVCVLIPNGGINLHSDWKDDDLYQSSLAAWVFWLTPRSGCVPKHSLQDEWSQLQGRVSRLLACLIHGRGRCTSASLVDQLRYPERAVRAAGSQLGNRTRPGSTLSCKGLRALRTALTNLRQSETLTVVTEPPICPIVPW